MPNKFDQIADNKKKAALAKQDEDVERFAKKVAGEVLGGIGDLSLKDSVAEFATSVAQAVVLSNETLDASLKDNFSQLLSAVKDNKPDQSSQVDLALKVGESLASLEAAFNNIELSPQINLEGISANDLRAEVGKIIARLPQNYQQFLSVYEGDPKKAVTVRLSDGDRFYKAMGGGSVVTGGGTSGGLTNAELRESPVPVEATIDTTGLATATGQTTGNASLASIDGKITAVNTGAVTVASSALPSGAATAANQQTDALTDTELRATPVPVSGTVTANTGLTQPLTDAQLRATAVPVSGTVTATPSGTQNVDVTANTIGLATSAKQDTLIGHVDGLETSTSSIDTKTPALGQALAAASTPVVLTAAQEAALTPPAAITGFATSAKQDTLLAELQLKADLTETQPVSLASVPTHAVTQSGTWTEANSAAIKTAVETLDNAIAGSEMQVDVVGALPAGTNAIGKLAANSGVDIGDVDVTSLPVAFNAGTLSATTQRVVGATGSTSTQTQVADSASSQTILAANTGRIRATIVNDSTVTLYLRESASAATTSVYTYKMYPDETVIIDDYNGALTGIWSANASGSAIVSEVTA